MHKQVEEPASDVLLSGQSEQEESPAAAYVLAMHFEQERDAPVPLCENPAWHLHEEEPAIEKEPSGQGRQDEEALAAYVLIGQVSQLSIVEFEFFTCKRRAVSYVKMEEMLRGDVGGLKPARSYVLVLYTSRKSANW